MEEINGFFPSTALFTGTLRVKQRDHWVSDSGLMCESLTHQRSQPLARVLQRMLHISFISVYLFVLAKHQ